jgi:hypothetical protein
MRLTKPYLVCHEERLPVQREGHGLLLVLAQWEREVERNTALLGENPFGLQADAIELLCAATQELPILRRDPQRVTEEEPIDVLAHPRGVADEAWTMRELKLHVVATVAVTIDVLHAA